LMPDAVNQFIHTLRFLASNYGRCRWICLHISNGVSGNGEALS
jgi:hypothetical protein